MSSVIAILVSDIHLSEKPPIARSDEPDWFAAMARQLNELEDLSEGYDVPIICAGDVFDRAKPSPWLINFALDKLPGMYSVAGQHDLPNHRMEDMGKSAFCTMEKSRKIRFLKGVDFAEEFKKNVYLYGYSWGENPRPCVMGTSLNILVMHKYVWHGESHYPGAPKTANVSVCKDFFKGYDAALVGDNHQSWKTKVGNCTVYNPGSFFRRRTTDIDHRPQVGLLKSDGKVEIHYLDVSQDILTVTDTAARQEEVETLKMEMGKFMEGLKGLGEAGLDFVDAVADYCGQKGVRREIRSLLVQAMEDKG